MKHISINDSGVFVTETRPLSPVAIVQQRRTVERRIIWLRGQIQNKKLEINSHDKEITVLQEKLAELNSPIVNSYLEQERKRKEEYYLKAQNLLREIIGDELYVKLQEQKKLIFQAKDNLIYKLQIDGKIYRKSEKQWLQLCIIRPETLPLPDFLLALFVSIKTNPTSYRLRRR